MSLPVLLLRTLLAFALLVMLACTGTRHDDAVLYRELGGQSGITAIVDGFLYELAEDTDVLPLFANTDIDRFREKFIEQLCDVSGGPCEYSGDNMRETHRDMQVTRAQFNSVVEDLIRAMERRDVPVGAQNRLLKRLAAMYGDIVYR
ncbi:group I truncated hemoglobin [Chromatocurvus halotolerans]|uniref:Group 1 truncated hemoglobin n=1 Tax=Chromatocurvus halotolerans TaxID=1132028 RepID=A0A4R2L8Q7_9GAMM|nr:group 1 truncated hemoglobin [Chromatocurvus halotolerans]TCO75605.1 hemoglobin [Chromatocurvus halotolerans]